MPISFPAPGDCLVRLGAGDVCVSLAQADAEPYCKTLFFHPVAPRPVGSGSDQDGKFADEVQRPAVTFLFGCRKSAEIVIEKLVQMLATWPVGLTDNTEEAR